MCKNKIFALIGSAHACLTNLTYFISHLNSKIESKIVSIINIKLSLKTKFRTSNVEQDF